MSTMDCMLVSLAADDASPALLAPCESSIATATFTSSTPSYMGQMFVHPTGQLMLLGGATWMFIGIMVMRGMINFKI